MVAEKIEVMAIALRRVLHHAGQMHCRAEPVQIGVLRGILERDQEVVVRRDTLFRDVFDLRMRKALGFIVVGDARLSEDALCSLRAYVAIDDIRSFATGEAAQRFSMSYDDAINTFLPVLLQPSDETSREAYSRDLYRYKTILIRCDGQALYADDKKPSQWFVYRYVLSLLSYLCLRTIASHAGSDVFVPILRLHTTAEDQAERNDDGDFLKMLSKLLAHMLGIDYLSNAQGYNVNSRTPDKFRVPNALSSLYSVLPKTFSHGTSPYKPALDRMAMVIVSSQESDSVRDDASYRRSTLYGEIVRFERRGADAVLVRRHGTFAGNYDSATLHTNLTVLIDEVHKLAAEGFEHIVYIARSPYSSTVNLTRRDLRDSLYFMSNDILSRFKDSHPNLKIYPVFCDEYYAVRVHGVKAESLYIQDTLELQRVLNDTGRHVEPFLNLFNGKGVRNDTTYNGVVSYATLINMHDAFVYDQDTYAGLLVEGPLKDDLIYYLTLFHFARYEAHGRDVVLKLDPYEAIIGDESVGRLSERHHMTPPVRFNFLSWLTEVREVVAVGPIDRGARGGVAPR